MAGTGSSNAKSTVHIRGCDAILLYSYRLSREHCRFRSDRRPTGAAESAPPVTAAQGYFAISQQCCASVVRPAIAYRGATSTAAGALLQGKGTEGNGREGKGREVGTERRRRRSTHPCLPGDDHAHGGRREPLVRFGGRVGNRVDAAGTRACGLCAGGDKHARSLQREWAAEREAWCTVEWDVSSWGGICKRVHHARALCADGQTDGRTAKKSPEGAGDWGWGCGWGCGGWDGGGT